MSNELKTELPVTPSHAAMAAEIARLREQRGQLALHCESLCNFALAVGANDVHGGSLAADKHKVFTSLIRDVKAFVATCKD